MYIRISLASFLFYIINLTKTITCIEIIQLSVPNQINEGSNTRLKCIYAFTNGEKSVYSLKWLLGRSEFYRETSNGKNLKQTFPLKKKFFVDLSNSGNGTVMLRNITRNASGNFNCEVTTNPNLETASKFKEMLVLAVNNNSSIVHFDIIWFLIHLGLFINFLKTNSYFLIF